MTAVHPEPSYGDMEGHRYGDLSSPVPDNGKRIARDTLDEKCLMCGEIGHWSSAYADAVYRPPAGHRLEYIEGETLIVLDVCGNHLVI